MNIKARDKYKIFFFTGVPLKKYYRTLRGIWQAREGASLFPE